MNSRSAASTAHKDRVIRVFVSSTFRDMMKERDLLTKQVFPALRHKCAKRFVTFTEVDLRWGITAEQSAEGQVLPLCLAEIERSRPYFLGLLGERYGWIPDEIPGEVIEREPWLREHVAGRTSVTELEILHGVLEDHAMQSRAFFYFRDPAYITDSSLTEEERLDLVERNIPAEVEKYGEAEATRRTAERRAKLAALKQRIRDHGLPVTENYANPEALAQIVRQQFDALIDELYPESDAPDPLVQERMAHEAYARQKLFACIDRPAHLAALNAFAEAGEQGGAGLVVTGESGGGKTALLAAWARDWAVAHADEFLFQHYFGATPESASADGFLHRLLGELKDRFAITDDIPNAPDKLREALPLWLAQMVGRGRVVLVLDGLNQVQGSDPDRRLAFLPRYFPPHVTVLASSLPGPAVDALRERGWPEHPLPPADEREVDAMVGEFLRLYGRHVDVEGRPLGTPLRRQLVAAPGSKNPLFLRTVLEELRQFGSFEELPHFVAHYLEAGKPRELFLRVLHRWQKDFDGRQPEQQGRTLDLVRRALTHLWAARQGLSEPEWLDLLGDESQPLPRALWTPLFFAIEPHLSQRAGLFAFGHDYLRQAVELAFVPDGETQQAAHLAIADYFEQHALQREMTPRKAAEWPYQLHAAAAWARLESCLTDIPLFLALYNDMTQWELTAYWHPLRQQGYDMGACYGNAYNQCGKNPANANDLRIPNELGVFLFYNGLYPAAEPLLRRVLDGYERMQGSEHPDTLSRLHNLAVLLDKKGDYAAAEPLVRRALEGRERALGPEHPDTLSSLHNLAVLLDNKGDYAGAESLVRRALEGRERALAPEHPDTLSSLHDLGRSLQSKGDYVGAEPLFRRAQQGFERVLGPEHPTTLASVNSLASLLESKGDYVRAESLCRRALEGCERVLGPEHPTTLVSVNNLAELLTSKGDYAGAEPLYRRALEGCERVLGPEHPDTLTSLNNLAGLMRRNGDYAGAEPLYRRALEGYERLLGPEHPNTLGTMNNLAGLLRRNRDYAGAESLYRRALQGYGRVLGREHPDTLASVNNLAVLLDNKKDYAGAEPLLRRALESRERVLGPEHLDTLASMHNLASLLDNKGDYAGAEPLCRRALEGRERVLGPEHPDTLKSVNLLAGLLHLKGDYAGAEFLYRRALNGRERVLGPEHRDTLASMHNLASLLNNKGDYAGAEPLYRRALEGCERVLGPEHPDTLTSVKNLASLLEDNGDYAGAEPLYRRALEGCERVLGPEHPDTLLSVNNLAFLLYSKEDYADAEPLFRRALEGLLGVTASLGSLHPHLQTAVSNYSGCLEELGRGPDEIRRTLAELGRPHGISFGGKAESATNEPSRRLGAVLERLMADPSQAGEIAAELQRDDFELFLELVEWFQSQP